MQPDYFQAVRRDGDKAVSLLSKLTDINVANEDGLNLLHMAIAWTNNSCAKELIRRGINVNRRDNDGQTPLHYAAEHSNYMMVESILYNGGNMNITDSHGNTPLWTAVFNARGNYKILHIFAKYDCSMACNQKNIAGRTPLDFAKQIGDKEIPNIFPYGPNPGVGVQ